MPYSNMSIEELALHIGMDAREVRRLADKGRLPGQMVGGQWRFNRAQLLDWLQREMHSLDPEHLANLEQATADDPGHEIVGDLLASEAIDLNLPAKTRTSVLRALVELVEKTGMVYDRDGLLTALEEREALCSTGLAGGFALPHPRRPQPYATAEPLIAIGRVPAGIPFGAPDGRLTDLFMLVCSHEERQHLHLLARLSMLLSSDLPDKLREAETSEEALAAVIETEQVLIQRRQ